MSTHASINDLIGVTTTKAVLARIFKKGQGSLPWKLDTRLKTRELQSLLAMHKGEKYAIPLFQLIGLHSNATPRLLGMLLRESDHDPEVENTVIMSGLASRTRLRSLCRSSSKSVREHAKLAMLEKDLENAMPSFFIRIMNLHSGSEEGISLGVRKMLAEHPKAPVAVLKRLSLDDADFISQTAKNRLANRKNQTAGKSIKAPRSGRP